MKIKQDPMTKLWCREDGAILMPPSRRGGMHYRWAYGSKHPNGYKLIQFQGKHYLVHQIICRAFNGLAPEGKLFVDHINRIRDDNRSCNIHWVSCKENLANQAKVDQALEKYGVRSCDDKRAYRRAYCKAYRKSHPEECKARQRAHDATHYAKMKAQGLAYRKGPNGQWGWFPFKRTQNALKSTIVM